MEESNNIEIIPIIFTTHSCQQLMIECFVSNWDGMIICNHSAIQLNLQVKLYGGMVVYNHTILFADNSNFHSS